MSLPQSVICPKCKTPAESNERFCRKCGQNLNISQQAIQEQRALNEMVFGTNPVENSNEFYFQRALNETTPETPPSSTRKEVTLSDLTGIAEYRYVGFAFRLIAYLLDDIILFALAYFITELFNPYPVDLIQNYSSLTQTQLNLATQQLSTFLSLLLLIKTLLGLGYFFLCEGSRFGQTIGMAMMHITLIDYQSNRRPSKQQVLLFILPKTMEIILIMDFIMRRSIQRMPANPFIIPELNKNLIRISQRIAHIAIIRKQNNDL